MAVRSVCRLLALTQAIFSVVQPASAVVHIRGISGGVNSATGERPARLELRTLQASGPAFDLFVLALKAFQEDDDLRSFYQIAGLYNPFMKRRRRESL
jgi:tyrosinase